MRTFHQFSMSDEIMLLLTGKIGKAYCNSSYFFRLPERRNSLYFFKLRAWRTGKIRACLLRFCALKSTLRWRMLHSENTSNAFGPHYSGGS